MKFKPLLVITLALLGSLSAVRADAGAANATPVAAGAPADRPDRGRILVVMTNHDRYPSRTDTTGLWLTELTHFTDTVEAAGYTTVFTSPKGGKVPLDERSLGWLYMDDAARRHLKSIAFRQRLENTLPIADIDPAQFRAIYFTGGHGVMWDFTGNADIRRVAEGIHAQGGVVAAVCHGVAGLLDLRDAEGRPLIQGRRVTGFSNQEEWLSGMKSQVPFFLQDRLVGLGGVYSKGWVPFTPYVVTDGRIVTGQNPQSPRAVAEAVLPLLAEAAVRR